MKIKDYQIVVSCIMIAAGCIFSAYILTNGILQYQKMQTQTIRVTGSAEKKTVSDFASWSINFSTEQPDLKGGYAKINYDSKIIKDFLIENGMNEKDIEYSPISSFKVYKKASNGYRNTDEIKGYNVSRNITVKSENIDKLTEISKNAAELVNRNIDLTSNDIRYYISNLDNIKIEAIEAAARNAKERAKSLVKGTNGEIGVMTSARVGVFQIIPVDSTEVSDYGINDTSSIEKKVIATVNAVFTVK